jgi:uncharacterized membrane protein
MITGMRVINCNKFTLIRRLSIVFAVHMWFIVNCKKKRTNCKKKNKACFLHIQRMSWYLSLNLYLMCDKYIVY